MSRLRRAALVAVAVGILGATLALTSLGSALEENVGLRWLFAIRGEIAPSLDVVVVDTSKRAARLPELLPKTAYWQTCLAEPVQSNAKAWPRCAHARLIDVLVDRGASVIVFDVAFVGKTKPTDDAAMANAIATAKRVVLLESIDIERLAVGIAETNSGPIEIFSDAAIGVAPFLLPKVSSRLNQFLTFRAGAAEPVLPMVVLQVYSLPALRQLVASDPMVADLVRPFEGQLVTNDATELRVLMQGLRNKLSKNSKALARLTDAVDAADSLTSAERQILHSLLEAYAGESSLYINFYGPPGTIRTIPGEELLERDDFTGLGLDGSVVFVGVSETSKVDQQDSFYTVFSRGGVDLSGVEIAATTFSNLLFRQTLRPANNLMIALFVVAFGSFVAFLAITLRGARGAASAIAVGAAYFGSAQFLFVGYDVWLPTAVPLLFQLPTALLLGITLQYRDTRRERENISRLVRRHVPAQVAISSAQYIKVAAEIEKVYAVCLATDVRDYSSLSEKVEQVQLRSIMNVYFDRLGKVVVGYHGSMFLGEGDSSFSVWKSQHPDKQQPDEQMQLQACLAALEMREAVAQFNQEQRAHEQPTLPTRIGLDAGLVADDEDDDSLGRYSYNRISVTGEAATTASRIQNLNKHLGTVILGSESVVAGQEDLLARRVAKFRLMGMTKTLPIFEIIDRRDKTKPWHIELCNLHASALTAFEKEEWSQAADLLQALLSAFPWDGPARFLLQRCKINSAALSPPDSGGIIRMEAK